MKMPGSAAIAATVAIALLSLVFLGFIGSRAHAVETAPVGADLPETNALEGSTHAVGKVAWAAISVLIALGLGEIWAASRRRVVDSAKLVPYQGFWVAKADEFMEAAMIIPPRRSGLRHLIVTKEAFDLQLTSVDSTFESGKVLCNRTKAPIGTYTLYTGNFPVLLLKKDTGERMRLQFCSI
jgi:hypothetical protein